MKIRRLTTIILILMALTYAGSRLALAVNYTGYQQTYQKQHWERILNNFIAAVQNDLNALTATVTSLSSSVTSLANQVANWVSTVNTLTLIEATPTFSDDHTFTLPGDFSALLTAGKRLQADCGADGIKPNTVVSCTYAAPNSTVVVTATNLTANLEAVSYYATRNGLNTYGSGDIVAGEFGTPSWATLKAADDLAAAAGKRVLVTPGNWLTGVNGTLNAHLHLVPGAILTRGGGDHLTVNKSFDAGDWQCIADNSVNSDWVIFESMTTAKPVWWGLSLTVPDNNHLNTRSAINALTLNTNKSGGLIPFSSGRIGFPSPIIDGTHPGNNLTFAGAGSVHATATGTSTPDAGTILEYSGTATLFKIHTADGTSNEGNLHWRDLTISCTSTGSGIALGNTADTMASPHPKFLDKCSLKNVKILGTGGSYGLAGMGAFHGEIDKNCYIQRFQYGVWLQDCDGWLVDGTLGLNSQNVRLQTNTATYGNSNCVVAMMNPLESYEAVPLYAIYDTAHATRYGNQQVEVTTGQSLLYLNGSDTMFAGTYLGSNTGVSSASYLGTNAKGITFSHPRGQIYAWDIQPPYTYYPRTSKGGDFSASIDGPTEQFASTVPKNPRIIQQNWPIPEGGANTVAGGSNPERAAHAAAVYMGNHGPHTNHLLMTPLSLLHMAGSNTGLEWDTDADASTGLAFTLAKYTATQLLERQLRVGTDVATTDSLVVSVRYKASDTPTGGICSLQVYNATTAAYIANVAMTAGTTSYQVYSLPVALSGSISAGDDLRIRIYHTWTGAGGDLSMSVDYLATFPVATKIHTRLMDFEAQADPGNTAADHGAVYWRKVAGKMQFFARAPSGGEILIAAEP